MQNGVKRDLESIRKLFQRVFSSSEASDRSRPNIGAIDFYRAYSALLEEMNANGDHILDHHIASDEWETPRTDTLKIQVRKGAVQYVLKYIGSQAVVK